MQSGWEAGLRVDIADELARDSAGLGRCHHGALQVKSTQTERVTTMRRLMTVVAAVLALGIASSGIAGAATSSVSLSSKRVVIKPSKRVVIKPSKRVVIKPGAVKACNARAIAVASAAKSYTAGNSGRPPGSDADLALLPSVAPYLKSTPYYTITIGKHGVVYVTPARGTPGYSLGTRDYETYRAPSGGNICSTV